MDFLKFFSLVRTKKLYFPSSYKLSEVDPFEGSLTSLNANFRRLVTVAGPQETMKVVHKDSPPDEWSPELKKTWFQVRQRETCDNLQTRKYIYVNSWHQNDYESLAMWKVYGDGLAIISSFEKLCNSLASNTCPIHIGCVQYVDFDKDSDWAKPLGQFIQKHIALRHEQEVRAVVWEHVDGYTDFLSALWTERERKLPDPPTGISLHCDLEQMLDRIILSPNAPAWAVPLLKDYCQETLGKEVVLSAYISKPYF